MVLIWYMNDAVKNPREENHQFPKKYITAQELYENCGVKCISLDLNTLDNHDEIIKLRQRPEFNIDHECILSNAEQSNYDELLDEFFKEHLHTEDEVRVTVEGSTYFDVRDKNDQWIRILSEPGDLTIIPSGAYHRFTNDVNNYVKGRMFIMGESDAPQLNRPAEKLDCREKYMSKVSSGYFANF